MGKLFFYREDFLMDKEFKPTYKIKLSKVECIRLTKKLTRHFKLPSIRIVYLSDGINWKLGHSDRYGKVIALTPHNEDRTIGLVVHELTHFFMWKYYPLAKRHHCSRFLKSEIKMMKYVTKMLDHDPTWLKGMYDKTE